MAKKIGSVTLEDYKGNRRTMSVSQVGSLSDVENIAKFLDDHSDARIVSHSITETQIWSDNDSEASRGKYERVEQKLVLLFQDTGGGEDNESVRFTIHAPSESSVNSDQEPESDLAEDVADLIADNTTRERTDLRYNGGGLTSRIPRSRNKSTTGV